MSIPTKVCTAVLFSALSGIVCLAGQARTSASAATTTTDSSSYPEQAYLSASHYVNQYFDFAFDLPPDSHLHPISLPAARNGNIQVLELGGPPPADAEIAITAIPTASGNKQDAKSYLREELDQELYRGVEELHGLTKANLAGHQFFYFETRRGIEQHVILATVIGDYIVEFVAAAHDEKMVKRLETSVEHLTFFDPSVLRQYLGADCKPYDGPSVSSHRLAALEENPPAKQIDPGRISGDFYENAMLGFSYRIPQGWVLQKEGVVQSAIERYRTREDFGQPRIGRTEHTLMDACGKTLFSAWAKRPGADGQISYDDFGEVTVSALSMSCFPTMKFPKEANDVQAFKDFVAQFGLTHPIVDDMGSGKIFVEDGIVFLYLHGAVAFQVPDDELSRRLSLAMAITERQGYLLTWFFAAPHDAELQGLTDERVMFDSLAAKVAAATTPGGGENSASAASSESAKSNAPGNSSPAAAESAAAAPAASNTAPGSGTPPATPSSAGDQPETSSGASGSERPSLLRPGETMQSQQGKGAVIVKPK